MTGAVRLTSIVQVLSYRYLYEIQEKTHGFSRGMNPSLLNQTPRQWQADSPAFKKHQYYI